MKKNEEKAWYAFAVAAILFLLSLIFLR